MQDYAYEAAALIEGCDGMQSITGFVIADGLLTGDQVTAQIVQAGADAADVPTDAVTGITASVVTVSGLSWSGGAA
jgi:hypothetical protein